MNRLDAMTIFVRVAELGSFAAAASRLGGGAFGDHAPDRRPGGAFGHQADGAHDAPPNPDGGRGRLPGGYHKHKPELPFLHVDLSPSALCGPSRYWRLVMGRLNQHLEIL